MDLNGSNVGRELVVVMELVADGGDVDCWSLWCGEKKLATEMVQRGKKMKVIV